MGSVLTQGPLEGRRLLAQRVELEQAEVFVDPLLHHPAHMFWWSRSTSIVPRIGRAPAEVAEELEPELSL